MHLKDAGMSEQAPAGWYPDAQGDLRYWDGFAWSEHVRAKSTLSTAEPTKKEGAFGKFGSAVKQAASDMRSSRGDLKRRQEEAALAAGALVTSGVFGNSTVEIYTNGFVRVASWPEGAAGSMPKAIDKTTPYELLRSITFSQPGQEKSSSEPSALEGAVGPAVASLMKGGRTLMKGSLPGLAAAGIAHVASNHAKQSFLTIATDRQIHTLSSKRGVMRTSHQGHVDIAQALVAAGNSVLGEPARGSTQVQPSHDAVSAAAPSGGHSLAERLRELADLHREGILSDDEFAGAKSRLIEGL